MLIYLFNEEALNLKSEFTKDFNNFYTIKLFGKPNYTQKTYKIQTISTQKYTQNLNRY